MKLAFRALTLWLVLGGLSWLFAKFEGDVMIQLVALSGLFLLPALGVWLTSRAVAALPERWLARMGFWAVTVPGWFALLVFAQGRAETHMTERLNLGLAFGLAGVVAVLLPVMTRSLPKWREIREVAATIAIFAFAGGTFLWFYNSGTQSIAARAEARWTEIGLPLKEFEKTLIPSQENSGSEILRQVLRAQVSSHFYKDGTRAAEREPAIETSEATTKLLRQAAVLASAKLPPSDDIAWPSLTEAVNPQRGRHQSDDIEKIAAEIEPLAPALDADYRRLLAAEPATWASDAHDGYAINVPNFLGIRRFAQLAAADATRRFSVGDQDGAARALEAGLRVREGLRQNPTLVSLMIDVAVEALLTSKQVRLPAAEGGLESVAKDVPILQSELLKRFQIEGWICLKFADEVATRQRDAIGTDWRLPKWAARIGNGAWLRRQLVLAALNGAEHAAIQKDPATAALPDLGMSLHDAVSMAIPTTMEFNATRGAMRMYATLLLREQTELIRDARARLAAGRSVESYDSTVVRGAHWELTADVQKGTVSTRLVGTPEWIVKNEVTPPDFWLLPLDGSVAWQFHRSGQTVSEF